jgi:hypothetical protein
VLASPCRRREVANESGILKGMVKKSELPAKICRYCGRPFFWRKKWTKVWAEVKYCSERCRRIDRHRQRHKSRGSVRQTWLFDNDQ